jgi:hypothetical protein
VPDGWYLVIEPGDNLITSGFEAIALSPGEYTYEWRDAGANDQVGGQFTINVCPTPTATPTCFAVDETGRSLTAVADPCATPTASRLPSPSAMPDTATGGPGGNDDGTLPLILLGSALLFSGMLYLAVRRRWAIS